MHATTFLMSDDCPDYPVDCSGDVTALNVQCAWQIASWLRADALRFQALQVLAQLNLPQAYLAAGFVRNLVWDQLHGCGRVHALNDLDVIYFDPEHCDPVRDQQLEAELRQRCALPWSVKNQARMHRRNGDAPYLSTADALHYWCERETAVAARWHAASGHIELVAAFGLSCLFEGTISLNLQRPKYRDFFARISQRRWLSQWPALTVMTDQSASVASSRARNFSTSSAWVAKDVTMRTMSSSSAT